MDSQKYQSILSKHMTSTSAIKLRVVRQFTLQGREQLVTYLKKKKKKKISECFKKIRVIELFSQSHDQNPIEYLRYEVKIIVHKLHPSNLNDLELSCIE